MVVLKPAVCRTLVAWHLSKHKVLSLHLLPKVLQNQHHWVPQWSQYFHFIQRNRNQLLLQLALQGQQSKLLWAPQQQSLCIPLHRTKRIRRRHRTEPLPLQTPIMQLQLWQEIKQDRIRSASQCPKTRIHQCRTKLLLLLLQVLRMVWRHLLARHPNPIGYRGLVSNHQALLQQSLWFLKSALVERPLQQLWGQDLVLTRHHVL